MHSFIPPILLSTYYVEGPMASLENPGTPEAEPAPAFGTLTCGGEEEGGAAKHSRPVRPLACGCTIPHLQI